MLFIDSVNRILRMTGYIRGDTDALTNFSNLQHGATLNVCIIAIQDSINDLVGDQVIPVERVTGAQITLAQTVRTYSLPADFAKFWQDQAFFYDVTQNNEIFEYPGGERQLQLEVFDYALPARQPGYPSWWYWVDAAVKTVGFFQVPDSTVDGRILTYDYQKSIMPTAYNDVMPFQIDTEAMAFCEMALIRFKTMMDGQVGTDVRRVPAYVASMAKVMNIINPKKVGRKYGNTYLSRQLM